MLGIVTITWNSIDTLQQSLKSLEPFRGKVYSVFIDGGSVDGTVDRIRHYCEAGPNAELVPQSGKGLYQALNQGILRLIEKPQITHIGILHSDDLLLEEPFSEYLRVISSGTAQFFYSDIQFHDPTGNVVRKWSAGDFSPLKLITGWMPPHTSVIVEKDVYTRCGTYDASFGTASDYAWLVSALSNPDCTVRYFPKTTVSMRVGGASGASLAARLRANSMDARVWRERSLLLSILIRVLKPARKLFQFKIFK